MSLGEVACTYSLMILHDDIIAVTKAAKVDVEAYWPNLFAKLVEKKNIDDLILNAVVGGAPASVSTTVASASATAVAPQTKEKKEEPKEESDDDMGFSLFD